MALTQSKEITDLYWEKFTIAISVIKSLEYSSTKNGVLDESKNFSLFLI